MFVGPTAGSCLLEKPDIQNVMEKSLALPYFVISSPKSEMRAISKSSISPVSKHTCCVLEADFASRAGSFLFCQCVRSVKELQSFIE